MARDNIKVPFGYEPERNPAGERGSLWVYDSFEGYTEQELARLLAWAEEHRMAKVVLYPLHEETLRRMVKGTFAPYHRRVDELEALLEASGTDLDYVIDRFEGKRKKYTPMDTAFRYLDEKYKSPHFVYVTEEMANLLAGYEPFETWIKRVRMVITDSQAGAKVHPKLQENASRWERY
ncbi:hypothetical protein [Paenibacillus cremeus]|uniref:Uncharacterized protein n=1 Tax=Paenibacillus cremeus TaxID=2163881 RepID=A0A559KF98_9BACL|nr:hypothetical protein [Paenibacillus cremeus]TVY10800.1 hypothetical protein FPZ49_06790 [Paenibacillus cremeus]